MEKSYWASTKTGSVRTALIFVTQVYGICDRRPFMGKFMGGCEVCHRLSVCVRFFRKMAKMYKMNFIARNELLEKAMTGSQLELPIFIELASWLYLISGPRKLFYASKNLQQRSLILQYNFAQKTSLNEPHLTQ